MPTAAVNDTVLHVESDGAGPPWVVIHGGLGVDHVIYRRTLGPLTDACQVVFFDQRGNGRSGPVDLATVTMEQLADDVAVLADTLGLDRFSVLGHSYGGFVAQEFALRHPDRLERLVLVDTSPGGLGASESPDDEQGPPPPDELLKLLAVPPASDDEMAAMMQRLLPFYFPKTDPERVAPLFDGTVFRAGVLRRGFEVLSQWSSVDRLEAITAPALLLVGRHDVFTSVPQSFRIGRRIPDATTVVLEHSGHFPWIEEPDAFFAALGDWVAGKPST
ncbi:MAG TPA: alpha/beta hydrolase [Acidimicrobiia bacterium]|nr:alpha/beta hydrolase [Acidimicrobiia bacterium]